MSVRLDHTIVWSRQPAASATWLAEILGLPAPRRFGSFFVVDLDAGVSLDFGQVAERPFSQHYAFLISEAEFDSAFARIRGGDIAFWADPRRTMPDQINQHDGGRGIYFLDLDGHFIELITRPYGTDGA